MKIRTVYFKVEDIKAAQTFWQGLLNILPHKNHENWVEFMCGTVRLGLLLNDFGDEVHGSGFVPVFEFEDTALEGMIQRAIELGAKVILDGLEDPNLKSVVMKDPFGHEFEFSKYHD